MTQLQGWILIGVIILSGYVTEEALAKIWRLLSDIREHTERTKFVTEHTFLEVEKIRKRGEQP